MFGVSVHVVPASVWVSSRFSFSSGFEKKHTDRCLGCSKLPVGSEQDNALTVQKMNMCE